MTAHYRNSYNPFLSPIKCISVGNVKCMAKEFTVEPKTREELGHW